MVSLVIKFSTPEQANAALDFNILIGREVYAGVVYNKACKSRQCFRCYSYGHIIVQYIIKEVCGYFVGKHCSKTCTAKQLCKCILCKGNHKAWDRSYPLKKQEIERISQARTSMPYRYPTKNSVNASL